MKPVVTLFLCAVLLLVTTGCWNRRELNELAIVVALGIDKAGTQYKVSVQVVDPTQIAEQKGAGANRAPVTMYTATGKTVIEALRKMTTISPRKMYLSHMRILVFGEALARDGIAKVLDLVSRGRELRTDFFIVVSKGSTAEDVLKILTSIEKIPANHLYASLETAQNQWAPETTVTLDELLNDLMRQGKHPVLSAVEIKGNQETGQSVNNLQTISTPTKLAYAGLAVFKKDRLIGWLNENESKGYNYIQNKVRSTIGLVSCPKGGEISMEVFNTKTDVKGKLVDGKPHIDVLIRMEQNVAEVQCKIDLTKQETFVQLENISIKRLRNIIQMSLDKVQKTYKVDIYGFGEAIHRSEPKAWARLKKNWDEQFADLPVNIKLDIKIRRMGTIINSIIEKTKE